MANTRALVIGGSMGGMIAAHLLRAVGWDAVIFERNGTDLISRGAGIGTHSALLEILRRIGIVFDDAMGVVVDTVICLDRDGRIVREHPTVRTMSSWAQLYNSLRTRLPDGSYRLGKALQRIEQDPNGVTAVFADNTRERGDLLIGADGIRSTVRAQVLPDVQPSYAGYVGWRVMIDEADIPPAVHRDVFESYSFCLPDGEMLLGYPVPGRNNETQAGQRAYNIVWYRPVEPDALVDLCTDAQGRLHAGGIPPPLIRPELIAALEAQARAIVAPQIAEIVARSRPFFQPIYDLVSPRITFGRVALMGDAAFVVRPHLGAGVTKAALDAESLADALREHGADLDAALARYQRQQQPFGSGMVALAQKEGAYLSARSKPPGQRSLAERTRNVDSVLDSHTIQRESVKQLIAERERRARP